MHSVKKKGHLYRSLQAMSILPLLVLGFVITIFSYYTVKSAMHAQVQTELKNMTEYIMLTYDLLYNLHYPL